MSWMQRCYQVYENASSFIGATSERTMLLPLCHTTQKANLEVAISAEGSFLTARVLRPDEMTTIIPCTEASSSRTSGAVPHPLADKLQYVAGDYQKFGGKKTPCWKLYQENLEAWCQSEYSHPCVKAVCAYLAKGCLIADLLAEKVLVAGDDGRLLEQWDGDPDSMPQIFKSTPGEQADAFVRFVADGVDLSRDPTVWESFIQYQLSQMQTEDCCYVQGKRMKISLLSPYKIRNAGDRAKLISSNDSANFTYRGRFSTPQQALSLGYETTQKAHSALRWLIGRQGSQQGGQTVLAWGTQNEPIPPLAADTLDLVLSPQTGQEENCPWEEQVEMFTTRDGFARQFNQTIAGYGGKLSDTSQISVMILDAATPGRLSIRYYQELSGSRLLENIKHWHNTYCWRLEYRKLVKTDADTHKQLFRPVSFEGAPSPEDIAKAAYGEAVDEKLKRQTVERLLACITQKKPLPHDLMCAAANRATAGAAREQWERRKTMGIACALIRGYYQQIRKEEFTMAVDETCKDRNYLYGRILACAEQVERHAQALAAQDPNDKRPTNAERFMVPYTLHPATTLALLQDRLRPYLDRIRARTGADSSRYLSMLALIDELPADESRNARLNELYLLGYASQKMKFLQESVDRKNAEK